MAENERCCERDMNLGLTGTTSFSHLLFSEDDSVGLFKCTTPSGFPADKLPKMLCFGDFPNKSDLLFSEKKSALTCTADSSSSSSSASSSNSVVTTLSNSINRKRNGSGPESLQCTSTVAAAAAADQRTSKKIKPENPTSISPPKRKEKLGERIAALQQLVSPFGKTDTASVLHEAMGYIRFLQEQVQVLCSPYLLQQQQQRFPSLPEKEGGENGEKEGRKDLRSRGLCLVPVECTVHVANSNGADFWSPAMASKE